MVLVILIRRNSWGPLGTIWDLRGPSGDHLGHGLDEVIDFITESDLPECADRSV